MLRGGQIIDQIKCYNEFSKHGLLMIFFYTKHMSVRLDKIDGIFVFSVHM
jgi:hypothetical protein